jgi:hypothetical protein
MGNVRFDSVENPNGDFVEIAVIEHLDGSFTSMPKAVWDELQAAKEAQSL